MCDRYRSRDYALIAVIMSLMGAFFWAIRGTGGYGGFSGGTLAGLGWAVLWLGFSRLGGDAQHRPFGNGRLFAAITFGIAYGGFTGYGVYTAWVNGLYQMNREVSRELPAWTGYAMLFLCGLHWGGITGAFMSWCAPHKRSSWSDWQCWLKWVLRIAAGIGGAILAVHIVEWFPQYFLPFYSEGYYDIEEYDLSRRAMRSLPNVMQHVGAFLGFFVFEVIRRDWRAVKVMLVMSLGFAIPFTVGGWWHTVHQFLSLDVDWWKNWEMTIGLGGGLAFGLAFYLFNRPDSEAPRRTTRLERIFGIGATLWFAVGIVILGAYEGFIRLHHLEDSLEATRTPAFRVYLIIATLLWLAWTYHSVRQSDDDHSRSQRIPITGRVLAAVLLLIIVCGYVVSLPTTLQTRNYVLLSLYTFYIGTSGLLFAVLRKRLLSDSVQTGFGADQQASVERRD